jgi:hypothetical protein
MSILPIQTKFTGISRPQKVSFATYDTVLKPMELELLITFEPIAEPPTCQLVGNNGTFHVLNLQFDFAEVVNSTYCRVSGTFGQAASIDGYSDPTWYHVANTDLEFMNFTLETANFLPITTTGNDGAIVTGVTFGFYKDSLDTTASIIPGYFESGTVILEATINRIDGLPFTNGEIIALAAANLQLPPQPLSVVSITNEGTLIQFNYGIGISSTAPFFLLAVRLDPYDGDPPPDQDCRITVEYYSDSGPSLN